MPRGKITYSAYKTHGIDITFLRRVNAPYFSKDEAKRIFNFIKDGEGIIAHNSDFDKKVLDKAIRSMNF